MPPDFDLAREYLRQAQEAHERGDAERFIAARSLMLIALGLGLSAPAPREMPDR